mmetsp:Transcript_113/g.253  ORF Transcript_113/g.253 Transcript_113/m.253 type:complete len:437 (+) Transcript_113:117-1427(+)
MLGSSRAVFARRAIDTAGRSIASKALPLSTKTAWHDVPSALLQDRLWFLGAAAGTTALAAGCCWVAICEEYGGDGHHHCYNIANNNNNQNHDPGFCGNGAFRKTVAWTAATTTCDAASGAANDRAASAQHTHTQTTEAKKLRRKKTALKVATSLRRLDTKEQLSRLRRMKDEMLRRWELDEEGWRKLPARAWPEHQPDADELEGILAQIQKLDCTARVLGTKTQENHDDNGDNENNHESNHENNNKTRNDNPGLSRCTKLLFDMATSLVFCNIDPEAGFALYERLAKNGHADSMVACGIVLTEGLGVEPREREGFAWLEKAMESGTEDCGNDDDDGSNTASLSSAQASYELGTIYYTGIDGIVEEDPEKAFALFERAAEQDHTAALYMVADCLVEGEGTERSVSKAVPLFYRAAERGHRYSRQRIRELLARVDYPL